MLMKGHGRSCSCSSISRDKGRITSCAIAFSICVSWTIRSGISKLIGIPIAPDSLHTRSIVLHRDPERNKMPLMEVYKQTSLEKAFNFTSHDLAENRQGRL